MKKDSRTAAARRSFGVRLAEGDSYGTLLILIMVTYLLMALLADTRWSQLVIGACFGGVLLLALHTSHVRGHVVRIAGVVVAVSILFNGVLALVGDEPFRGAGYLVLGLIVLAPVVILVRIFRHPVINIETVLGAIDAYLLIAITFAAVYRVLDALGSTYFFAQGPAANSLRFLYFSFVVITTLGFGDLTPGTDIGRVLVTVEALLGQLFLVTIVAVLVSNLGRARGGRGSAEVPSEELEPE